MDFLYGYSENKLKPYLKMAVQRIQIATNKKSTAVKHQKREIAQLLADHKDEKARIKVEHIIREDFVIEAYEMLELLLELIHERIRQVTSNKEVPTDLKEAVCSLIWAASNVDISEFQEIKKQLTKKYGSEFAKMAETNEGNVVNARLFQKLTYKPPSTKLVMGYLVEIAKGYQVEWTPSESGLPEGGILSDLPMTSPVGFSVPMAPASDLRSAYERTNQGSNNNNGGGGMLPLDQYELEEQEQFRRNQANRPTPVVFAQVINDQSSPISSPHLQHQLSAIPQNPHRQVESQSAPNQQQQQEQQPPVAQQIDPPQSASSVPSTTPSTSTTTAPDLCASQDPFVALQARLSALQKKT